MAVEDKGDGGSNRRGDTGVQFNPRRGKMGRAGSNFPNYSAESAPWRRLTRMPLRFFIPCNRVSLPPVPPKVRKHRCLIKFKRNGVSIIG